MVLPPLQSFTWFTNHDKEHSSTALHLISSFPLLIQLRYDCPFIPHGVELSGNFSQCTKPGMVTNTSLHVRQVWGDLRSDQRAGLTHNLKPVFCDDGARVAQV